MCRCSLNLPLTPEGNALVALSRSAFCAANGWLAVGGTSCLGRNASQERASRCSEGPDWLEQIRKWLPCQRWRCRVTSRMIGCALRSKTAYKNNTAGYKTSPVPFRNLQQHNPSVLTFPDIPPCPPSPYCIIPKAVFFALLGIVCLRGETAITRKPADHRVTAAFRPIGIPHDRSGICAPQTVLLVEEFKPNPHLHGRYQGRCAVRDSKLHQRLHLRRPIGQHPSTF